MDCWSHLQSLTATDRKRKESPEFLDDIIPVFVFDDLFQKIVHALKYQGIRSIGIRLGKLMSEFLRSNISAPDQCILIPIPLHPIKYRERGYNQSELISLGLKEELHISVRTDLIKRVKNTQTQTKLDANERKANMQDAFRLTSGFSNHKFDMVYLIDDVYTTGSTMNSAAKVLREGGIRKIIGITAATPL